jgi:hypothetical protein
VRRWCSMTESPRQDAAWGQRPAAHKQRDGDLAEPVREMGAQVEPHSFLTFHPSSSRATRAGRQRRSIRFVASAFSICLR